MQQSPASFPGIQSRLSQSLYGLKEFAAHLLGLHAPAMEPGFGFCKQQCLELPSGLPCKSYPGPMLLNFSVPMGTGVSNMAWSADNVRLIDFLVHHQVLQRLHRVLPRRAVNNLCRVQQETEAKLVRWLRMSRRRR